MYSTVQPPVSAHQRTFCYREAQHTTKLAKELDALLPSTQCHSSTKSPRPTMSLPHLPAELQNLIIANLHPTAAIALSQTNHHYHSTVSLHLLDPDTVHKFLYDLQRLLAADGLYFYESNACYTCLCIKPRTNFKFISYDDSRQCLDCQFKGGSVTAGSVYRCGLHYSVICTECFELSSSFCEGCRTCARCLERKHSEICTYCDWCDRCVEIKMVEWESRREFHQFYEFRRFDHEQHFERKEACKHRFPGCHEALNTISEFLKNQHAKGHADD